MQKSYSNLIFHLMFNFELYIDHGLQYHHGTCLKSNRPTTVVKFDSTFFNVSELDVAHSEIV